LILTEYGAGEIDQHRLNANAVFDEIPDAAKRVDVVR
jgi:hypothetical protein